MENNKDRSIVEVCGGIASGKTTFANLFDTSYLEPLFEDFKKSPFWEAFYCNPGKYIFETELSFILLHYHQIKNALEVDQKLICDFSFFLDLAYAKMGLTGTKLEAFECVLGEIRKELPTPNLIVYLQCDAETEMERIQARARKEEELITLEFLDSLNKAVGKEVDNVRNEIPVITVDSSKKDFANVKSTKEEMVQLVNGFLSKF